MVIAHKDLLKVEVCHYAVVVLTVLIVDAGDVDGKGELISLNTYSFDRRRG